MWGQILASVGQILLEGLVQGATQTVANWVNQAIGGLTKAATKLLRSQTGLLGWLGDKGADLLENVSSAIQDNVSKSVNTINEMAQKQLGVWKATERNLKQLTNWVGGKFQQLTTWISGQLGPILQNVGNQLGFTQRTVKNLAKQQTGLSSRGMDAFTRYLKNNGTTTVTQAEAKQVGILDWLKNKAKWLGDQIRGGFERSLNWLKKKGVKMASTVAAFVSGIGKALITAVTFLLHGLAKLLEVDPDEVAKMSGQLLTQMFPSPEEGPPGGERGPRWTA